MIVKLSGGYKPTPYEIAKEIWEMNSFQQLRVLHYLANIADTSEIYMQMDAVNRVIKECPECEEVINFVEKLGEYITGE